MDGRNINSLQLKEQHTRQRADEHYTCPNAVGANAFALQPCPPVNPVSFLAVPIRVLVPISVPIYTKNDIDKLVHSKIGTFI